MTTLKRSMLMFFLLVFAATVMVASMQPNKSPFITPTKQTLTLTKSTVKALAVTGPTLPKVKSRILLAYGDDGDPGDWIPDDPGHGPTLPPSPWNCDGTGDPWCP